MTANVNGNNVIYFKSFLIEHVLIEIKKFIGNKNIITNFYRIEAYDSIMCWYFCIGFIGFMFKDKNLADSTILFHQVLIQVFFLFVLKYKIMIE